MFGWAIACSGLTACVDSAVEMSLTVPTALQMEDTSCVTAVEVRAIGANYAQDPNDYQRACMEVPRTAHTYRDLRDVMHGRFNVDLPESGLRGVTVRGWAGISACERTDETNDEYRNDFTSNLVFYAKAGYIGQDDIDLPVVANLKCPSTSLKVRVVDMLALVKAGSSAACSTAISYTDKKGWSGVGTIVPKLFGKGVEYFGNASWAEGTNNMVQFDGMVQLAQPGQPSCLALAGVNEKGANTACLVGGQSVCAAAGELESAAVDYSLWNQVDRTLQGRFPSIVWGSVWSNASPRTPIAGATVSVDPEHGKVVYLDPPDSAGIVRARSDQSGTGASGLFVLYSDAVVTAKITGGGKTRTLPLGAPDYTQGGAMVVMQ